MLSEKQLIDIKKLQQECERNEPFQLKLNWEMLQSRANDENLDFFHYVDHELVGFLGLYGFGTKIEVCGMVKQNYRRQGIFTKLFNEALAVIAEGNYNNILLNVPANSLSGKAFVNNYSCEFTMAEHQMKYAEKENNLQASAVKNLCLRHAGPADLHTEVSLDVQCFGFSEAEAIAYNKRVKQDPTQQFYMIDYHDNPVGRLRVGRHNGEAWIYGFAIFPEHQGKGYGKQALLQIIKQEHAAEYDIFLEVEAKNAHALKLYEACGFRAYQSQDYYKLQQ